MEGGKSIDPVRLYSTFSGFPVDGKGDFKLTVEYFPQKWFSLSLAVSQASLVAGLGYLLC